MEKELTRLYTRALADIIKIIKSKGLKSSHYEQAIMSQILAKLEKLDKNVLKLTAKEVPKIYKKAMAASGGKFTQLHEKAINILVQNMQADLLEADQQIGRSVFDIFRQIQLDAGVKARTIGYGRKVFAKEVIRRMTEQGLSAFTDKRGRQWRPDAYARMVARSVRSEASNKGTENSVLSAGRDLVQMSSHNSPCPTCAPFEDRVYSITGKDKRYPALYETAFHMGYAIIHPNCKHFTRPYIEELKTATQLRADRKHSNSSFDVDPRSERQRRAYIEAQAKKRAARQTLLQYERYKARLGSKAPKTYASFASMKSRNKKAWRELRRAYRSEGVL